MKPTNIIGVFENDEQMVDAINQLKKEKVSIKDAHTPFPVHQVLHALGKESRMPYASFLIGVSAVIATFSFLYFTAVIDYPISYGGKPYFSVPSFVVVMFLVTILGTAIGTVLVFHNRTKLFPGKNVMPLNNFTTDDKFVLIIDKASGTDKTDSKKIHSIMKDNGAIEVYEDENVDVNDN